MPLFLQRYVEFPSWVLFVYEVVRPDTPVNMFMDVEFPMPSDLAAAEATLSALVECTCSALQVHIPPCPAICFTCSLMTGAEETIVVSAGMVLCTHSSRVRAGQLNRYEAQSPHNLLVQGSCLCKHACAASRHVRPCCQDA